MMTLEVRTEHTLPFRKALLLLAAGWFAAVLLSLFPGFADNSTPSLFYPGLVLGELLFLLPAAVYLMRGKFDMKNVFNIRPVSLMVILGAVIAAPGVSVIFDALDRIIFSISDIPAEYWEFLEQYRWKDTSSMIYITAALVLAGPVAEELMFRGMLLNSMVSEQAALWRPLVFSSLLFAMIHVVSWVFLQVFLFAMLLGILTRSAGSVIPAVLVHAIYNLIQLVLHNTDAASLGWYVRGGLVKTSIIITAGISVYVGYLVLRPGIRKPFLPVGGDGNDH